MIFGLWAGKGVAAWGLGVPGVRGFTPAGAAQLPGLPACVGPKGGSRLGLGVLGCVSPLVSNAFGACHIFFAMCRVKDCNFVYRTYKNNGQK